MATFFSTMAGIIAVSLYQRINLLNRTILLFLGGASLLIAGIIWLFLQLSREQIDLYSTTFANVFLFLVIIGFIVSGMRKRINVYDAFVEGAKEGFSTAVRIIPYLVAILVSIGVFRASGAMDFLIQGIAGIVRSCGIDDQFVGALPHLRSRFVCRPSGLHLPGGNGYYILYSGGVFRKRQRDAYKACVKLRADSRLYRNTGCHFHRIFIFQLT